MSFLKWLYRKDIAETITYLGGYVCNRQISRNMDILERYPWLENMEKSFEPGWRLYKHDRNRQNKFNGSGGRREIGIPH